jgi:integrase
VGYILERTGTDGKPRYTAVYRDLRGRKRSAGTYANKKEANKAWQRAEVKLAEGRVGDPRRGRQTLETYVREEWLPHHMMERTTRQSYCYLIERHILPDLGPMRMAEVLPAHIREWVSGLTAAGVKPPTIDKCKVILSAVFTTALNDQVTFLHPCKGVKTPPVAVKPRRIVTPDQFDTIYQAIPPRDLRLLVETDIESGMRWGEVTELRPKDVDVVTRIVTISRAAVELNPKFHPEGRRFLVKEYPKDQEYRRFRLSRPLVDKLVNHIATARFGPNDLLFTTPPQATRQRAPTEVPDPASLGHTEPNDRGRRYRHGTLSGYSAGRCRCRHCKDAYAIYRAHRRAAGQDQPRRPRSLDTDGHISRNWFRLQIWKPAVDAAGLPFHVRVHDLRHAHASWLLAGGADLQVVKERLGHASIATTEKYLHTLPDADDTALTALERVRQRIGAA